MPADINNLLDDAARATAEFLNRTLPALTDGDWWNRRVLQFLSQNQLNTVHRHCITELSQLDLAALLQTLDSNWRSLDDIYTFSPGALNFIKEMRSVRNRWSHRSANPEHLPDDIYRDLDTLERFLGIVGASDILIERVRSDRFGVLLEIAQAHSLNVSGASPASAEASSAEPSGEELPADKPETPSCPACDSAMVQRTARNGPHKGKKFWGCSEWSVTGCNGIINIPEPQNADVEPPPTCPDCQSRMVLRTARGGPYAGSRFWGCSEWGITGCSGLVSIQQNSAAVDEVDLPF